MNTRLIWSDNNHKLNMVFNDIYAKIPLCLYQKEEFLETILERDFMSAVLKSSFINWHLVCVF